MLETTSSTTTSHTVGCSSNLSTMASSKLFPCNTCELVFESSQAQRTHMREPWHVYNLKRRMAELPPITSDDYADTIATSLSSKKPKSIEATSSPAAQKSLSTHREVYPRTNEPNQQRSDESEDVVDEQASINHCLFCIEQSDGLEANLEHMSSEHGLYLPEVERLSSLEATVGYLRIIINEYNECLYCGMTKQTPQGIRTHMLDKGHCMINLEREPELLEFWEFSSSDDDTADGVTSKPRVGITDAAGFKDLSPDEYTLPSGKIVASKGKAREARLIARRTASAAKETSNEMITMNSNQHTEIVPSTGPVQSTARAQEGNHGRTVAVRDAAGLIGVSDQQVRSLITVQRKMQRQQAIVRASTKWADELGGTHQKHYKQKMNLRDG